MSEFALVYRSTSDVYREATSSPEKVEQSMRKWRAWFKEMADSGQLKDFGVPLERVGKVVGGKKKAVTDGPYAETKDVVGGFSVIEAESLDEAARIASGCPILEIGGVVEVRPVRALEGLRPAAEP